MNESIKELQLWAESLKCVKNFSDAVVKKDWDAIWENTEKDLKNLPNKNIEIDTSKMSSMFANCKN
jgi:hypothetical protein